MALSGINIGRDIVASINDSNGIVVTSRLKSFSSKQKTDNRESVALDGVNRHANIPKGWEGNMEFERTDASLDQYIYSIEQLYYQGKALPVITLTITISNPDGSISEYQFINVVFQFDDSGTWSADQFVMQKITFMASARNQLL